MHHAVARQAVGGCICRETVAAGFGGHGVLLKHNGVESGSHGGSRSDAPARVEDDRGGGNDAPPAPCGSEPRRGVGAERRAMTSKLGCDPRGQQRAAVAQSDLAKAVGEGLP